MSCITLSEQGLLDEGLPVRTLVLPDRFIDQDKPEIDVRRRRGSTRPAIVARAFEALGRDVPMAGLQRA